MTNSNDATFPSDFDQTVTPEFGLTKREYFAAAAMQGICSSLPFAVAADDLAAQSAALADALIAELNKAK